MMLLQPTLSQWGFGGPIAACTMPSQRLARPTAHQLLPGADP